jgi:hypothetical protein
MNETIMPSLSKSAAIAANFPTCVRYFDLTMNIINNVILGRDKMTQMLIPGRGLFGLCKGFFASLEFQRPGNLHAHWVVHTYSMPTTTTRFLQLAKDQSSSFMNRLLAHLTPLVHAEVPIAKGAIFPKYNGSFQLLVLPVSTFKRPKYNVDASIVANCPKCKTYFTREHLLWQITAKLAISKGIIPEHVQAIEIENLINALDPFPFCDATSHTFIGNSVILTLTILTF